MSRLSFVCGVSLAALCGSTAMAVAADTYEGDFGGFGGLRGGYEEPWGSAEPMDPVEFELGVRYWYSLGSQQMSSFTETYSANDKSHILEGHFRIDDISTSSYVKGQAGYAVAIDSTYDTPYSSTQTTSGGVIGYAGADFGYMPFGNDSFRVGALAGYQYLRDNPNMGRISYTTADGGGDSNVNEFDIHTWRIGAVAKADLGDMVDINAQGAFIPYAPISGTYGSLAVPDFTSGSTTYEQGSAGQVSGSLYGVSGEVMLGVHPTEHLTLRLGGRAYYLKGDATMEFDAREVGNASNSQRFIDNASGLEFFRYGALAEITGSF